MNIYEIGTKRMKLLFNKKFMKGMNTICRAKNIILCNDQRKRSKFTLLDRSIQGCGNISFIGTQNDCGMFCLA